MSKKFVIYGEPCGKGRPRASSINGFIRMHTDRKTSSYEAKVQDCYLAKYRAEPTSEPLKVSIIAFFGLSKSDYKKDGNLGKHGLLKVSNDEKCMKKPDLDNIAKIVLDPLNGIAFHDDSQVVCLYVEKRWGEIPRVEVGIETLR